MTEMNQNMKILVKKLDTLKNKGITYHIAELYGTPQVIVQKDGKTWCDVASHFDTYGGSQGLLEGYLGPFVTTSDEVIGHLDGNRAFRIIEHGLTHDHSKSAYPKIDEEER